MKFAVTPLVLTPFVPFRDSGTSRRSDDGVFPEDGIPKDAVLLKMGLATRESQRRTAPRVHPRLSEYWGGLTPDQVCESKIHV